jgi:hypothetical protein
MFSFFDQDTLHSGSVAAQQFRGRYARESANPQDRNETILLTKKWLERCTKNDPLCSGGKPRLLPTRVVDIRDTKPKLHESKPNETGLYVALSYSWGDASSNMLKLKNGTRKPLTHKEGILAARELNYDYIWIDALCIIQDDNRDWEEQSKLLPQIFGNADLTIVAGRSGDARNGFLEPTYKPTVSAEVLPYRSNGIHEANCSVILNRNHLVGPTNDRGWCFQEASMARRMLVYGEQQLSFRCRQRHNFEDGYSEVIEWRDDWYNPSFLCYYNPIPPIARPPLPNGYLRRFCNPILQRWYSMAADYSMRNFFNPRDNHAALSGLAVLYQKALVGGLGTGAGRYMAGLWEVDMVRGLLWRSRRIVTLESPALKPAMWKGVPVRRAPSWSWMALVGPIYQGPGTGLGEYEGGCLAGEPCCTPVHADGKTWGSEPNGWGPEIVDFREFPDVFSLEVKAYILQVRVSQYRNAYDYVPIDWKHYLRSSINQHTFLLEAEEDPTSVKKIKHPNLDGQSATTVAAIGFFDMEYINDPPSTMWAMRLTSVEGLLLEQSQIPKSKSVVYKRLGIFAIMSKDAFYPKGFHTIEPGLERYDDSEDSLPTKTIVLV